MCLSNVSCITIIIIIIINQLGKWLGEVLPTESYYEIRGDGTIGVGVADMVEPPDPDTPGAAFITSLRFRIAPAHLSFIDVEPLQPSNLVGSVGKTLPYHHNHHHHGRLLEQTTLDSYHLLLTCSEYMLIVVHAM